MPVLETIGSGSAKAFGLNAVLGNIPVNNPVTSGLVFFYDAENTSSYAGSGSNITDLSGNGKTLQFGSSNVTWAPRAGSAPAHFNFTGITDSDYLYHTASTVSVVDIVIGYQVAPTCQFLGGTFCIGPLLPALPRSDRSFRIMNDVAVQDGWFYRPATGASASNTADWQHGNESLTLWNGTISAADPSAKLPYNTWGTIRSYSSAPADFTRPFTYSFGAGAFETRRFIGKMNFMMGFNRQLNSTEVQQIHNAFKVRYPA